jgi:hypothetical protein
MSQEDDTGSYTRVRFNAQVGDGPDQRGDVTVEVQRPTDVCTSKVTSNQAQDELDDNLEHLRSALGLVDE